MGGRRRNSDVISRWVVIALTGSRYGQPVSVEFPTTTFTASPDVSSRSSRDVTRTRSIQLPHKYEYIRESKFSSVGCFCIKFVIAVYIIDSITKVSTNVLDDTWDYIFYQVQRAMHGWNRYLKRFVCRAAVWCVTGGLRKTEKRSRWRSSQDEGHEMGHRSIASYQRHQVLCRRDYRRPTAGTGQSHDRRPVQTLTGLSDCGGSLMDSDIWRAALTVVDHTRRN